MSKNTTKCFTIATIALCW